MCVCVCVCVCVCQPLYLVVCGLVRITQLAHRWPSSYKSGRYTRLVSGNVPPSTKSMSSTRKRPSVWELNLYLLSQPIWGKGGQRATSVTSNGSIHGRCPSFRLVEGIAQFVITRAEWASHAESPHLCAFVPVPESLINQNSIRAWFLLSVLHLHTSRMNTKVSGGTYNDHSLNTLTCHSMNTCSAS